MRNTENRKPFLVDPTDDPEYGLLSLVKLIGGKKIKDVHGYINEFNCFHMTRLFIEDGTEEGVSFFVEGSHDDPYLYEWRGERAAKYVVDLETLGYQEDE